MLNILVGPPLRAAAVETIRHAVIDWSINEEDKGVVNALVRGKEFLLPVAELRKAGLVAVPGPTETIGGVSYVSLDRLAPRVTYKYDEANVALHLTVDPTLLSSSTVDLGRRRPPGIDYLSSPSAFVNYAIAEQNLASFSAFSEQGLSFGGLGPADSVFFDNVISRDATGRFTRGDTNFTLDNRSDLLRLQLGDTFANGGNLGGLAPLGGIGFSRAFSIDPYFTSFPGQRYAGVLNTPSIADIYVNGVLVNSVNLPAGPFNLQNIPALAGSGNTRIVIRNAFGQQQVLGGSYYLSTQTLQAGLHEFTYNLGFERNTAIGTASGTTSALGDYGRLGFLARHRYGWTDDVTPGAFFEGDQRVQSGGPEVTVNLPIGQLGAYAAGSRDGNDAGWAGAVNYNYVSTAFSIGGDYSRTSRRYATLSVPARVDRPLGEADVFASVPLGFVDLSAQLTRDSDRDSGRTDLASLSAMTQLADWSYLTVTLSHSRSPGQSADNRIFLSLGVALDSDTSATFSASRGHGGAAGTAQIQKSLPRGEGFGYLAQLQGGRQPGGAQPAQLADLQYQGPFGLYELDYDHQLGQNSTTLSASGALAYVGGDLFATRALTDGYALIRVSDVGGVTGLLENQAIGRTDSDGELLIPNLLSYSGNRIGIDDQDISMDYAVNNSERTIAPLYRAGAVVDFAVHRLKVVIGTVKIRMGNDVIVPAYGELAVTANGEQFTSPIGSNGQFYFEGLPPGSLAAAIHYRGDECDFTLPSPETAQREVNLGEILCVRH